jgi:hypothetical protein
MLQHEHPLCIIIFILKCIYVTAHERKRAMRIQQKHHNIEMPAYTNKCDVIIAGFLAKLHRVSQHHKLYNTISQCI